MTQSDDKTRLERRHYSRARLRAKVEDIAAAIARDFSTGEKRPMLSRAIVLALRTIYNAADKNKLDGELENMTIGWLSVHERESAIVMLAHDKGVLDDVTKGRRGKK